MAGIRNTHAAPPRQKEAVLLEDLLAMLDTLDRATLRGLHDRAMLLISFAGGLRRSEIVGLDLGRDHTEDGRGWIEILDKGLLVTCAARPAGERSRSATARPTRPARSLPSRPGSSSPGSPEVRSSAGSWARARTLGRTD